MAQDDENGFFDDIRGAVQQEAPGFYDAITHPLRTIGQGASAAYDGLNSAFDYLTPGPQNEYNMFGNLGNDVEGLFSGVVPGVSKGEADAAATKLADAQADMIRKEALQKEANRAMVMEQLQKLRMASAPGTEVFAAKGDDVRQSDNMLDPGREFNQDQGSFSSYSEQNAGTRERDRLKKMGLPDAVVEVVQSLKRAKTPGEARAAEALAKLMPNKLSPEQEDSDLIMQAMKVKDPIGAMPLLIAALRRKGRSDEYIKKLLAKVPLS